MMRPYEQVCPWLPREVPRHIYEHLTNAQFLALWPAKPGYLEEQVKQAETAARNDAGCMFHTCIWGSLVLGSAFLIACLSGTRRDLWWIPLLMIFAGLVLAMILPRMFAASWLRRAAALKALGAEAWITSHGILRGPDCWHWKSVWLRHHFSLVHVGIKPGTPAVLQIAVFTSIGPPGHESAKAVAGFMADRLFGGGAGSGFRGVTQKCELLIPPGREQEAEEIVQVLKKYEYRG